MPKPPDIHPDAPAGGGGPGFFRSSMSLGLNPDSDVWDNPLPLGVPAGPIPVPFPTTTDATAPVAVAAGEASTTDPDIEALRLSETAKKAAYELKKKHPSVVFTSGFRTKEDQARAMAGNVVSNRNWIRDTYIQSTARDKCQKWVDEHKDKKTKDEIAAGLEAVMDHLTDTELARLRQHPSRDAVDLQPVEKDA